MKVKEKNDKGKERKLIKEGLAGKKERLKRKKNDDKDMMN